MCYCDARSFTAQRCVAQCAALYSPPAQFLGPRAAEQPVLQRLETPQKVCAFASEGVRASASLRPALQTLRAALNSARHCTAPNSPHPPQHCTAPSTTLHRTQRAKTRSIAASEPRQLRKGGLLKRGLLCFLCSISAHENRSADTRAHSFRRTRNTSKAKPERAAQRAPVFI